VIVLREVLDEIREALEWQNNNAADFPTLAGNRLPSWPLAEATPTPTPRTTGTCNTSTEDKPDPTSTLAKQRKFL
jgi:hypothetical protein